MAAGLDRKTAERKRKALEKKYGKPYAILRASNGETAIVSQEWIDECNKPHSRPNPPIGAFHPVKE